MIKLPFLLLLLHTFLFANINIENKAITISLSSTLSQSKEIANHLRKYDIYIYKTTSTKKSYYVIYAVNIKKENLDNAFKSIKKIHKDAYFTSDEQIKQLSLVNFSKSMFIKSIMKTYYNSNNKIVDSNINLNKKSLFITNLKNKKELFLVIKKYHKYDLFVEKFKNSDLDNYDICCSIYIVNINTDNFNNIFTNIKKFYTETKKIPSTLLKYKHEREASNKFIKKSIKKVSF